MVPAPDAELRYNTRDEIERAHRELHDSFDTGVTIDVEFRKHQLKQLSFLLNDNAELIAEAMFIPQRGTKNYLLWPKDNRIIRKGSWRSRSRSNLEKEFPVEYLTNLIQNQFTAESYFREVKSQILSGKYPVEKLAITRKIREGEKELLKLGKPGDVVTYYYGVRGLTNIKVTPP